MLLISFAFILLFQFIPAPAGLNQTSMQVIGIFIGIMLMWNFIGTDWPSLLCMAILAIFQIMSPGDIFKSGFGNSTIAFLLVFFMLSHYDATRLRSDLQPMSVQEKISAVLFVVVIVIWLLQGFLKDIAPTVGGYISALGNAVPVMVAIVILCLTKVDGKPIMDYKDAAARGVPWSALIFNAAVLVISGALTLEKVGISDFLISNVTPLVSGMNQTIFILVIATLCIIATNFSSNTVCATVFYTISAPIALAMGNINMVALASVIGAAASYAFATPPSTMPMAVVAGTGWVDVKDMFKYGGLMALLSIVILAFVGYPIAAAVL